jgi:hypothetical protein
LYAKAAKEGMNSLYDVPLISRGRTLEEACLFCWEAYRKDFSPPPLIDARSSAITAPVVRSGLLGQVSNEQVEAVEGPASLDRLDDAGIDELYHRSLREYARSVKRQSGALV